jgi:hypothetical protein
MLSYYRIKILNVNKCVFVCVCVCVCGGGGVHFCYGFLSRELTNSTHHMQGRCPIGESTCQARDWVFSSKQIPVTLSALPHKTVDSHLHFWLLSSWGILHIFSPFLELPMPFKNTQFLHSAFTTSQCS